MTAHSAGTGERTWARDLGDALHDAQGLEVRFRELTPHAARLMETLGVRAVIDPRAPQGRPAVDPHNARKRRR